VSLAKKSRRYFDELIYTFRIGADWWSKFKLSRDMFVFHGANALRKSKVASAEEPHQYAVNIRDHQYDILLRTLSGDLFIFYEIFLDETYVIPEKWREDVHTIVDLGAHVGLVTLYLSSLFPNANFVCVEPNPGNFNLLKQNLTYLGEQVHLLEAAVGCESPEVQFSVDAASWGGHIGGPGDTVTVKCYSMNELIDLLPIESIDVLKVDIERAEALLFAQDCRWIKNSRIIMMEIHEPYSLEAFREAMDRENFEVFLPGSIHGNRILMAVSRMLL
jgi:FkbM family methyltransferase